MKLLAIRNFNEQDPLPPLGPKHEPPKGVDPAPVPVPVPGKPGLIRHPDGKLETDLPPPAKPEPSEPPTPALDYTPFGGKKADSVTLDDYGYAASLAGRARAVEQWAASYNPVQDWLTKLKPAASEAPFAVGDRVKVVGYKRFGDGLGMMEKMVGKTALIAEIGSEGSLRLRTDDCSGFWFHPSEVERLQTFPREPRKWTVEVGGEYTYFNPNGSVERVKVINCNDEFALIQFLHGSLAGAHRYGVPISALG